MDRIDHIGIAVWNLDDAVEKWRRLLGKAPDGFEDVPSQQVRVAFFQVGESRIELVSPTTPDSPIAKSMKKRGEGLHHVCFGVEDADAEAKRLEADGARLAQPPGDGAGGTRVAFVHPRAATGVLIEVSSQKPDADPAEPVHETPDDA